ncbi:MAG: 5'-nucleotidase/UDP-sugar diphosphatase [Sulfurimonas sp.]|jgi:5'-nucleotidase/UDP-sugar diphosphatase|uniref:bifunctional metallophosphatase/5'-nucleotidase n=1 Tax=Sulfurimonas sp. TaxID=2022749 RepID=UPI0039E4FCCF
MKRRKFLSISAATSGALLLTACSNNATDTNEKSMILRKGVVNANSDIEAIYMVDAVPSLYEYDSIIGDGTQEQSIIDQDNSQSATHKIKIFHINDMHNHTVDPSQSKGDTNRLAQIAKVYKEAVASAESNESIFLLSAGDDHTGNVLDELRGFGVDSFVTDAAYEMYSALGFSAVTIGNHELDKGGELLKHSVEQSANMPLLSANVAGSKYLTKEHYSPAMIAVNKGLRVGMIGLTTPNETASMTEEDPNRVVTSPSQALTRMLPLIASSSDVVLILSHLGYGGESGQIRHDAEVADIDIAQLAVTLTSKPVIIIGGHSHTVLNKDQLDIENVVDGVLITQAGGNGSYFGEISATLTYETDKTKITHDKVKLHTIKKRDDRDTKHNPLVNEIDADIDLNFKTNITDPILAKLSGKLAETLATVNYEENMSLASTLADRYVGESTIANFMNDAIVERSKSFPGREGEGIDLAAFNASGVSSGVEDKPNLTFQDWYGVMPFADAIFLTQMSGLEIKEMIQSNVTRLLLPAENSINGGTFSTSGYISWGFLHFSKDLTYSVSYDEVTRSVIASDINIKGNSIESQLSDVFKVAFSSYIASGFEFWKGESVGASHPGNSIGYDLTQFSMQNTGLIYRNEIISYIVSRGTIGKSTGALKDNRIKFLDSISK